MADLPHLTNFPYNSYEEWWAWELLRAAAKTGHRGTVKLAMVLGKVRPELHVCDDCDYVKKHCRCDHA